MAAIVADNFQRAINSFGTWNWGDVALGFRAGLLPSQQCLRGLEFTPSRFLEGDMITPMKNIIPYTVAIQTTWGRELGIAGTGSFILPYLKTLRQIHYASLATNFSAQLYHMHVQGKQDSSNREKKLSAYILKASPFFMMLTNMALSLLEFRSNRMKATISLAVTSLVLLDYAKVMPFAGYLNPGLRIPMDLIAMYYANNRDRFAIAAGWVEIPYVSRFIYNRVGQRFSWIMPFLRLPAAFLWRV